LQDDGNAVIYRTDNYAALWQTRTSGLSQYQPFKFVVQEDGNLVLYDKDGKARWDSGTAQAPKEVKEEKKKGKDKKKGGGEVKKVPWKVELKLQNDGNLVLYREDGKVLWTSGVTGYSDDYTNGYSNKEIGGTDDTVLTGSKTANLNEVGEDEEYNKRGLDALPDADEDEGSADDNNGKAGDGKANDSQVDSAKMPMAYAQRAELPAVQHLDRDSAEEKMQRHWLGDAAATAAKEEEEKRGAEGGRGRKADRRLDTNSAPAADLA
jgi:hypothetical protein